MAQEYTQPEHPLWETYIGPVGSRGLQLNKAIDALLPGELAIMSNLLVTSAESRALVSRAGQTQALVAAGAHHSLYRLNKPLDSTFARFAGVGTTLQRVVGGGSALASIASGFSGHPLSLVAYRPPLSGESYLFIADRNQMLKVTTTGTPLPIGLPIPTTPTSLVNARIKTDACAFNATDGTQASAWTLFKSDPNNPFAIVTPDPTPIRNVSGPPGSSGNGVEMGFAIKMVPTQSGATGPAAFGVGMASAQVRNLSVLPGPVTATDDDLVTLNLKITDPNNVIQEIRIYFVVGAFTLPAAGLVPPLVMPGSGGPYNTSAYMRSFRPSDYQQALLSLETTQSAAERVRTAQFLAGFGNPPIAAPPDTFHDTASLAAPTSQAVWSPFDQNFPVRRGDFTKIGVAGQVGTDWSNVSGILVTVHVSTLATTPQECAVAFNDCFLTGGFGPYTADPGMIAYDYRATNYDSRTGAESNPSVLQVPPFLDAFRQSINLTPSAYGDGNIRQRFYRRGGTLTDNWYFVGTNASDGGIFVDTLDDQTIQLAGTVFTDHDQPVTTVGPGGNTILAQPLSHLIGPIQDLLIGWGDPYRPGDVYWCKTAEPDHWPSFNHTGVCSPSEQLLNGGLYGGQAYVASRERWYTLLVDLSSGVTIVGLPTPCADGLAGEWACATGPDGIYYVAKDGVRKFAGDHSVLISDALRPLFHGEASFGYLSVDLSAEDQLRIAVVDYDVWFTYKDTGGTVRTLIYSLLYQYWRPYDFHDPPLCVYAEPSSNPVTPIVRESHSGPVTALLLGGTNQSSFHLGDDDNGTPISYQILTGAWDAARPREDKLLGDVILDADFGVDGVSVTAATLVNNLNVNNLAQVVTSVAGRHRYIFDPFGNPPPGPQMARNAALSLAWTNSAARSILYFAGIAMVPDPDTTMNRVTTYEPLPGAATDGYTIGMRVECDTFQAPRTIHVDLVDADNPGVFFEPAGSPFTVNPLGVAGRHVWWFSWPVQKTSLIRIRPADGCLPWKLYRLEWLSQPEPPRIAGWDTNWENKGDTYCTGVDIECDTYGVNKTVVVYLDQTPIATLTVHAAGRRYLHFTIPTPPSRTPIRGHLYRLVSTDANPGRLYSWKWWLDTEPTEQTNWNQNFSVANTLSDKWIKGMLLEIDTFGQTKNVHVEVDGLEPVGSPFQITATGRSVIHLTWPKILGRVIRLMPDDSFPSRLYERQWIFDEDPISVTIWETEELDHQMSGWHYVWRAHITLKSTADVTLTLTAFNQLGVANPHVYTIPSTAGRKQKCWVPFDAVKGILWRYFFTSASPFTLYLEESEVHVQDWNGGTLEIKKPFGDADIDVPTRNMINAGIAAGRSGGGTI